ncbi:hypothetical protein E5Q_04366 [Mixia osmundae IAM 14324]|uniref:Phytoene desaturase n=1 Tax=Mixia osmundae (strain CBS 9802 / IAM 14324 / JCM 22182 / KY 12970) TaxID=764103 RepID=G7E4C8_MIXOS|nr:hypothetical protein E5Q_04366 [Mixia osmundae IAM 14324]
MNVPRSKREAMPAKKVIIIGGGVGGICTAARLGKAGVDVTVIEKNDTVGGRCSLLHADGHRFDVGPSFYLMPEVFEELFDDLGESVSEHYTLKKCEPNYKVYYHDDETVTLSTDMAQMKQEVEKWEGKDGWHRFLAFMRESHVHYEDSLRQVLHANYVSYQSMIRPHYLVMAIKLHVFDNLYRRASNYFWTDRLRRAFTFSSMYLGMSPFNAPATYNLLQYTELAQGIWYPVGGFFSFVRAVEQLAKTKFGVKILYNTPVGSIKLSDDGKTAKGVVLATDETLTADLVICNADLVYAYNNLLPPTQYAKNLTKQAHTCSSISFYWGLNRKVDQLVTHQIFLAENFKGSFDRIFQDHSLPDEPSFYVNVPSRVDPTAAPEGRDTMVVLVPVGHLTGDSGALKVETEGGGATHRKSQDWDAIVARARAHVIAGLTDKLNKLAAASGQKSVIPEGKDFSALIGTELSHTPLTWQANLNLHQGSILGLSHSIFQVLAFRPRTKHDTIDRLHFVGASTHPGTGVPVVVCGSKITSQQVLEELQIDLADKPSQGRSLKSLDKVVPPMTLVIESFLLNYALPGAIVLFLIWLADFAESRYAQSGTFDRKQIQHLPFAGPFSHLLNY